jgi:hypothetical protein
LESFLTVLVKDLDRRDEPVELTTIADANCKDGDCPAVYTTNRGTVAVQGYLVTHKTPAGEAVVEIPAELLAEAVRALGG